MTPQEASAAAHKAGQDALEELFNDDEQCQCETCITRVVLEAAFPHLRTLVHAMDADVRADISERLAIDPQRVDPALLPRLGGLH